MENSQKYYVDANDKYIFKFKKLIEVSGELNTSSEKVINPEFIDNNRGGILEINNKHIKIYDTFQKSMRQLLIGCVSAISYDNNENIVSVKGLTRNIFDESDNPFEIKKNVPVLFGKVFNNNTNFIVDITPSKQMPYFKQAFVLLDIEVDGQFIEINPNIEFDKGLRYIEKSNFKEAIIAFTSDILSVETYGAYPNRAYCYVQVGDVSSAIKDYKKAHEIILTKISTFPNKDDLKRKEYLNDLVEMQCSLGQLFLRIGSYEESYTYFQNALLNCLRDRSLLSTNRSLSTLYSNSAIASLNLKNYSEAAKDMAKAIKESKSELEIQGILMHAEMTGLSGLVNQYL